MTFSATKDQSRRRFLGRKSSTQFNPCPTVQKGDPYPMRKIRQIARHTLSLALVAAISLTSLCFTQRVQANPQIDQTQNFTKSEDAPKLSPRLKAGKRGQDERVSVILELNTAPSRSLRAFLRQDGVHLRREMKRSYVYSIDLPFN